MTNPYRKEKDMPVSKTRRRTAFTQWLVTTRKYPEKVARDIDTRCRLIEFRMGIDLESIVTSEKKILLLMQDLKEKPELILNPPVKRRNLGGYLFAIRRFREFRTGKLLRKWSRGV